MTILFAAVLSCAAVSLAAPGIAAEGPKPHHAGDPDISLALDDLGFESPQPRLLTTGATMFTVNFVDDTHLLLTYNTHGLLPRLPDASPDDDDRLVAAKLVELPSGKVLAETKWHTRDRLQYLWPLSHGLFLLRIRSHLTVIDPVGHLGSPDPFQPQPFLDFTRRIGYIAVSPDGDLLTVETVPQPHFQKDAAATLSAIGAANTQNTGLPAAPDSPPAAPAPNAFTPEGLEPPVEVRFFRLLHHANPGQASRLIAQSAGALTAQHMARIPVDSDGFLDASKESEHTWDFDFQSHAGKRLELSPYDTDCAPSAFFISRTDFVALGCHGDATRFELSGFNLRGEEPWISVLSGQQLSPTILPAPAAGRFAFSRILLANSYYDAENLQPDELSAQEIIVYQNHDGRTLLKTTATPIQRAGQNFDLSPDGLQFVVIHGAKLDVYTLPQLTDKDRQQLKLAASNTPEPNEARIRLLRPEVAKTPPPSAASPDANKAVTVGDGNTVESAAPEPTVAQPHVQDPTQTLGDATPDKPRPRPSLYTPDYPKPPPR
jgi:hypothetical protein